MKNHWKFGSGVACSLLFAGALALSSSSAKGAPISIKYYGGPVVENPSYVAVYWGSYWTSGAGLSLRKIANQFFTAYAPSLELESVLSQYTAAGGKSIHPGVFAGEYVVPGNPASSVDDSSIQTQIKAWIGTSALPAPTADTIYVMMFPPNITVTQGGSQSCAQFCGYHSSTTSSGPNIRYLVIPHQDNSGCILGCGGGAVTSTDRLTVLLSMEMAQATTDPDVGLASTLGPPLAWYDSNNGEIGDVCVTGSNPTDIVGNYTVQRIYSNKDSACVTRSGSLLQLSAAPSSVSLTAGAGATVQISSRGFSASNAPFSLTVDGLPSGVSGVLSKTSIRGGDSFALDLSSQSSAAAGSYTITVTATSGSYVAKQAIALTMTSSGGGGGGDSGGGCGGSSHASRSLDPALMMSPLAILLVRRKRKLAP